MFKKRLGGQAGSVMVEYALILAAIALIVLAIYRFMPKDLIYLP